MALDPNRSLALAHSWSQGGLEAFSASLWGGSAPTQLQALDSALAPILTPLRVLANAQSGAGGLLGAIGGSLLWGYQVRSLECTFWHVLVTDIRGFRHVRLQVDVLVSGLRGFLQASGVTQQQAESLVTRERIEAALPQVLCHPSRVPRHAGLGRQYSSPPFGPTLVLLGWYRGMSSLIPCRPMSASPSHVSRTAPRITTRP